MRVVLSPDGCVYQLPKQHPVPKLRLSGSRSDPTHKTSLSPDALMLAATASREHSWALTAAKTAVKLASKLCSVGCIVQRVVVPGWGCPVPMAPTQSLV